jgi:AraC family transcriptional regulator
VTEQLQVFQQASPYAIRGELTVPQLFLSSEGAGWEDLALYAYHEPLQIEGWIDPIEPDVTLVLLTRGAMLMEQQHTHGLKACPLRQGDLVLKPAGSVTNELRWNSLNGEPMQTLRVHLNSDLFARAAQELADRDPARLALVGRVGFQDPLLAQIGLALQRELEQPTATGKLYAQTAAQMLAVHLLRYYTDAPLEIKEPAQGLTQRQLRRVTDFILAHLDQELSLPVLAQQVGFSPYHFARLFRRTTGESPHQFVLRQRIERAKQLLKEADLPLAHIALESGFANQGHLTRVFKSHLGLTPAAYRKDF